MASDRFRDEIEALWKETDERAQASKDSQSATLRLVAWFGALAEKEQSAATEVIEGWLTSPEERKRFDALAIVEEFRLQSAKTQLMLLQSKLDASNDPGARFESSKVARVLGKLSA